MGAILVALWPILTRSSTTRGLEIQPRSDPTRISAHLGTREIAEEQKPARAQCARRSKFWSSQFWLFRFLFGILQRMTFSRSAWEQAQTPEPKENMHLLDERTTKDILAKLTSSTNPPARKKVHTFNEAKHVLVFYVCLALLAMVV